jgi:hypothetical protein
MTTHIRTMKHAALMALVLGVAADAHAAGGATPAPPVIAPPSPGAVPSWAIAVPVQLASIPSKFPRFAVDCSVWTPRIAQPWPFQDPNPRQIGAGRQDWALSNGAYTGSVTVKVFVAQGYLAEQARGGSYSCFLKLIDANKNAYDVGPNAFDNTLRPQQGTTFVGSINGPLPP